MGKDKGQTKQTTGSMPRESSQVGTHGQTGSNQGSQYGKNEYQGQGSQGHRAARRQGANHRPSGVILVKLLPDFRDRELPRLA